MNYFFPLDSYKEKAVEEKHSDKFIEITTEYVNRLKGSDLPVIFSLKHLSIILNIPYQRLLEILNFNDIEYTSYKIKKRRGGFRHILSPKPQLSFIQKWIYENILLIIPLDKGCFGFRKNYSIKDNANFHKNQEAILKIDLYRFFDTITQKRVYGLFKSIGYHSNLSVYLAKFTTTKAPYQYEETVLEDKYIPEKFLESIKKDNDILPQGAPSSPNISNIIASKLDLRLRKLAEKTGIRYSRYADDITFSGPCTQLPKIKLIEQIIIEESFYVNKIKTRISKKWQKQIVTGLTVTDGVHVPKSYKKDVWRHLYFSRKYGPNDHLKKINQLDKACFKDWLLGRIFFVKHIEPNEGERMLGAFKEILWGL